MAVMHNSPGRHAQLWRRRCATAAEMTRLSLPGTLALTHRNGGSHTPDTRLRKGGIFIGKLLPSGAEYFEWKFNIPGITIVDLSSVRDTKALTVLVEMLLWNICSDRMGSVSKDPSPLVLLLDECQRLRFNDGDTSVRILREGRKYGIWGWFSTQWIDDKTASKALAQAGIRLIFHPGEDSLHNTARRLARGDLRKSEMIEKRLSNLKQGQFILQKGSQLIISQPPIH